MFRGLLLALSVSGLGLVAAGDESLPMKSLSGEAKTTLLLGYRPGGGAALGIEMSAPSRIYRWAPLAIVIQRIECDGRLLAPVAEGLQFNQFDAAAMDCACGSVLYVVNLDFIPFVERYDAVTGEYTASAYEIPRQFKKVTIWYSGRMADGTMLAPRCLEVASDERPIEGDTSRP